MKTMKTASKLMVAMAFAGVTMASQAATYSTDGVITSCTGICGIFTAVGQTASFAFDAPSGPASIGTGDISNVGISLSTPSGGSLAFTNGFALSSTLSANGANQITGGAVQLQGVGATTGIVAQSALDFNTNTWTAYVVSGSDGSLEQIASGTLSAVPVPAAAWLFGSALVGLTAVGRKRRAA